MYQEAVTKAEKIRSGIASIRRGERCSGVQENLPRRGKREPGARHLEGRGSKPGKKLVNISTKGRNTIGKEEFNMDRKRGEAFMAIGRKHRSPLGSSRTHGEPKKRGASFNHATRGMREYKKRKGGKDQLKKRMTRGGVEKKKPARS